MVVTKLTHERTITHLLALTTLAWIVVIPQKGGSSSKQLIHNYNTWAPKCVI